MKSYLILSILLELLKKERVKARDIAGRFEVSTRTVYRYLNELEYAGVPTVTFPGKNGGLGIDASYKLNTIYFTQQEKQLIINCVSLLTFDNDKEIVQSIIAKLSI